MRVPVRAAAGDYLYVYLTMFISQSLQVVSSVIFPVIVVVLLSDFDTL